MAAHGLEARSGWDGWSESANTPLGSFVRDSYADDCARFVAELKQRVAAGERRDDQTPQLPDPP